jgi:hypothetical protein
MAKAGKRPSTLPGRVQFAGAVLGGKGNAQVNTIPIEAGRTKHGPGRRYWGQSEYAQAAIGVLYPNGIPPGIASTHTFKAKLVRAVQKQLDKDSVYRQRRFKPIGRNTILRAAGLLG